jgi:RNA-directed DNA polymerase
MFLNLAKAKSRDVISNVDQLAKAVDVRVEFIRDVIARKEAHYSSFPKIKPDGTTRMIEPPKKPLRKVQRKILNLLYSRLRIPGFLHGGLPNRSILTHAEQHVGKQMVGTFDLKNFYPSVSESHVMPVVQEAGIRGEAAAFLLELVMLRGGLAQGAPTSSLLANLGFVDSDVKIRQACRRRKYAYSRFVDDIAISGDFDVERLKGLVKKVVEDAGFRLANKTKFRRCGTCQIVTGLVVNDKLRPTTQFIQSLRSDLRFCRDYDPELLADERGISRAKLKAQLEGRVRHLRRFDPRVARDLNDLLQHAIQWNAARQNESIEAVVP